MLGNIRGGEALHVLHQGRAEQEGKVLHRGRELCANKDVVKIQVAARGLDRKDRFGRSDPYFVISKATTGHSHWTVVAKSTVVDNTL